MPVRATSDPAPARNSAKVGERVVFSCKVENSTAAPETVVLTVEGLPAGTPPFVFDPVSVEVPRKSRKTLAFAWTAVLPEDKDALTYRGRLLLRTVQGRDVGAAPLDLYVERS